MKKKIEELNLLDNFLFGSVVTYPEIGEEFVRLLLKSIFNKDFGRLTIVPQKEYPGADTDLHGARLDVYVEAEPEETGLERASVYDVEPEQNDRKELIRVLPRRVRFYHAKIDAVSLGSGEGYRHLKNVIVIMIVPFDPFGKDRIVYTIRNMCQEEPGMPYDDGARTLFLYTKGTRGRSTKKLRELLRYMEDTTESNAVNSSLRKIHRMVEKVKRDKEVSLDYMKIFEREEMIREEGREEEMANTDRERRRAEEAEKAASAAMREADEANFKLGNAMKTIQELSDMVLYLKNELKATGKVQNSFSGENG
ncbi:MAG: Rpn family recombination-promoting nuclease/putative transposase [Lachnospiraceae bacterium]|nr:Rpn family recombination-promoting nuclease/putative transposase [Lachnospiraceae bacterium]